LSCLAMADPRACDWRMRSVSAESLEDRSVACGMAACGMVAVAALIVAGRTRRAQLARISGRPRGFLERIFTR
jgi:hypothetical protein